MEPIDRLKRYIRREASFNKPGWLDDSNEHKQLWSLMQLQYTIIAKNIKDKFLSEETIFEYFKLSSDCNELIYKKVENDLMLMAVSHIFIEHIQLLQSEALYLECFETLQNVNRFAKLYYTI